MSTGIYIYQITFKLWCRCLEAWWSNSKASDLRSLRSSSSSSDHSLHCWRSIYTCPHCNGAVETAEQPVLQCLAHDQAWRQTWPDLIQPMTTVEFDPPPDREWERERGRGGERERERVVGSSSSSRLVFHKLLQLRHKALSRGPWRLLERCFSQARWHFWCPTTKVQVVSQKSKVMQRWKHSVNLTKSKNSYTMQIRGSFHK